MCVTGFQFEVSESFKFKSHYLFELKRPLINLFFFFREELIILSSSLTSTFTSSSSPDSLNTEKSDSIKSGNISPTSLYKLVVPLLRCEAVDVRDAAVHALGRVNSDALK